MFHLEVAFLDKLRVSCLIKQMYIEHDPCVR